MRSLKAPWKDYRRRRALARAGIAVELSRPTFAAGERSGTWVVDPTDLAPESVVYSVGVGDNLAWDVALIERFGLTVHAFDPTPRSRAWVERQELPDRLCFHAIGLAGFDGTQVFHAPAKSTGVSFRPATGDCADGGLRPRLPVRRFATLTRELGHGAVDVLKIDVEGGEYALLPDLLEHGPHPAQLLLEFHHDRPGFAFADTERAIRALRAAGYRILHISDRGLEFTFLRT